MYVCLCEGVTSATVTACVLAGARSSREVAEACRAGAVCGRCRATVRAIIAACSASEVGPDVPGQ